MAQPLERGQTRPAEASVRARTNIDAAWRFTPEDVKGAQATAFDDSKWARVAVPHTWNIEDTQDDAPGYRQGVGWYRRNLELDASYKGKRVFLYFEGVNQVTEVFVNGRFAGLHKGGYTAFAFDITNLLSLEAPGARNVVAVKVDNSNNKEVPPSPTADFNFYGGIYRDVWLVATDPIHLAMLDYGSSGVYVETPEVTEQRAVVKVRGTVTNNSSQPRTIRILNTVLDGEGRKVTAVESTVSIKAGEQTGFQQTSEPVLKPRLWSPDTPYLYSVRTELYDGAKVIDEIANPLGFRWFSFDSEKGFTLNGKSLKLRGANRHQDYKGMGNAVPNELQVKDMELIKAMGLNCVLLAHYPQDPSVVEAADRLGLIVWEELPIIREITTTEEFARNCREMLKEMIRQHYNHPSVIVWCYMNEVFLRMHTEEGYVQKVLALARSLEDLAHEEDAARITAIGIHRPASGSDIYNSSGLTAIPQVVGWHMYFGWYYGSFIEMGRFLDQQHRRFPAQKIFISEYGADSNGRLHSLNPARGDSTAEWAQLYHENYMPQIERRPYLSGSALWNAFDFGSEARGDTVPHLNTKGVQTYDRKPKDIYYYYRALYSREPVLRVATHEWLIRAGSVAAQPGGRGKQPVSQSVKVYSNLPEAELFANGESLGVKRFDESHAMIWNVPFKDGLNIIEARARSGTENVSDRVEVRFSYRAPVLADASVPFSELAVNTGSHAQFIDDAGVVWEADKAYTPGGWGFMGGEPGVTTQNVLGSVEDALYQTVLEKLKAYRFDVPDGAYEVELRFVEHRFTNPGERVFNVAVNGQQAIRNLDLVKESGAMRGVSRTIQVTATKGQGVLIEFNPVKGDAVLSAIRIRRAPAGPR